VWFRWFIMGVNGKKWTDDEENFVEKKILKLCQLKDHFMYNKLI
jgi:hypothetical protein